MVKVRISDGILEGEKVNNQYGGTYYSFKGIPYAKPPLGDLRFQVNEIVYDICIYLFMYVCITYITFSHIVHTLVFTTRNLFFLAIRKLTILTRQKFCSLD